MRACTHCMLMLAQGCPSSRLPLVLVWHMWAPSLTRSLSHTAPSHHESMHALHAKAHVRMLMLAQGCPSSRLLLTRVYHMCAPSLTRSGMCDVYDGDMIAVSKIVSRM